MYLNVPLLKLLLAAEVCLHTVGVVKASVKSTLGNAGICFSNIDGLDEVLMNVPDVFEGLETTYMQEKYFRDHFNLMVS